MSRAGVAGYLCVLFGRDGLAINMKIARALGPTVSSGLPGIAELIDT